MHTSEFSPAQLPAALRSLFLEWQSRAEAGLPPLTARGFQQLAHTMSRVALTEILRDSAGRPVDFRLIYVSAALRPQIASDVSREPYSTQPGKGPGSEFWRAYAAVTRTGLPHRVSLPYEGPDSRYDTTTELLLPLAGEHGGIGYIMSGILLNALPETIPPWATWSSDTIPPGPRLG